MSDGVFKAPKAKKAMKTEDSDSLLPYPKRQRTAEDFYTFCNLILEYENYESTKQEDLRAKNNSPLDSVGSSTDSFTSESSTSSTTQEDSKPADLESDDDSWDLVTCFCMKPFAGRPMIECCECLTWIHLSCAKIRKSNIPEQFVCQRCRDAKLTTRRSSRVRSEKKRITQDMPFKDSLDRRSGLQTPTTDGESDEDDDDDDEETTNPAAMA